MASSRRINLTLSDEDYGAWIVLSKRLGVKPSTLALRVVTGFLKKNGLGEPDLQYIFSTASKGVGIYFRLSERSAKKLDFVCWKQNKVRQNFVKKIVVDALKNFN